MKPQKITFAEAKEKYDLGNLLFADYGENVFLYESDTFIKGDLDIFELRKDHKDVSCIIFDGNLTVDGTLSAIENYPAVVVLGNLNAKNMIASDPEIAITGNVEISNTFFAYYNDGSIIVKGSLEAKTIINSDHAIEVDWDRVRGVKISAHGDNDIPNSDFKQADLKELIVPEVLTNDGYIDDRKLCSAILEGKQIIKVGAKSVHD